MQTRRSFRPIRALAGAGMILAGSGVIFWELFIHVGRIRVIGLGAALLIGIVGGVLVLFRSLARVCAACGTEIEHVQMAFPEETIEAAQSYASRRAGAEVLLGSRLCEASDQRRAVLVATGCHRCRVFETLSAHRAVWSSGGYFEAKEKSRDRPVAPDENPMLAQLFDSRLRPGEH